MRRFLFIASIVLLGASRAHALCQDGPPFACQINGKPGTRACENGHITPCTPDDPTPAPRPVTATGTAAPNYVVLTVIYAPPGTKGGHASSSVSYGSGSNSGTTTSTTKSFKNGFSVSAKATAGFLGTGTSVGASFAYSGSSSDGKSLEIKKTATSTIKNDGPSVDGIDHDHDVIYLWLNPQVALTVKPNSVDWTFTGTESADVQFVYVGWLKNPASMPPGVAQALMHNGVTSADYPAIMAHDPFAVDAAARPGPRYVPLNTTFPYEPPFSATDPAQTNTFSVTSSTTNTTNGSSTDDYKVGLTLTATAGSAALVQVALSTENSWEWTNTSSHSAAGGTTESASLTVGGPAFGYTGSTDMEVFYDTIYKTFLFRPVDGSTPVRLRGKLVGSNGAPMAFREVKAVAGGKSYRTFTDAAGNYRFFGTMNGPVRLQSGLLVHSITAIDSKASVNLQLH